MNNETKNKIVPKMRFPAFRDKGEWDIDNLGVAIKSESSSLAQNNLQLVENGFPVYGASGLIGFTSSFIQDEDYIAIIKDGSGVGKLFLYEKKSSILGTLSYLKSQDNPTYDLIYLFYLLQTINLSIYIKGSGIPHIYYSDYAKELIAIPKPTEQQKIASCLSSLDEFITAQTQKLEALETHKKGLMQQLFPAEGETVPKLRFAEFRDSGDWEEKSIQKLIDDKIIISHLDGNHGELYPSAEEFAQEGIPYISANDFINGVVDFKRCKFLPKPRAKLFKKGVAKDGDILFAHNATVGPVAKLITDYPFVVLSTTATYFRCDNTSLLNDFLKFSLSSSEFVRQYTRVMSQSTRNQVPITTQRKFNLHLPKIAEQQKIAHCLSSLDELIAAQTEKIEELKAHKKGLLQGLFPNIGVISNANRSKTTMLI